VLKNVVHNFITDVRKVKRLSKSTHTEITCSSLAVPIVISNLYLNEIKLTQNILSLENKRKDLLSEEVVLNPGFP